MSTLTEFFTGFANSSFKGSTGNSGKKSWNNFEKRALHLSFSDLNQKNSCPASNISVSPCLPKNDSIRPERSIGTLTIESPLLMLSESVENETSASV